MLCQALRVRAQTVVPLAFSSCSALTLRASRQADVCRIGQSRAFRLPPPASLCSPQPCRRALNMASTPASSGKDVHRSGMSDVEKGAFKRKESIFRRFVKADGSTPFAPEAGRYRLYISLACPWASRVFMTLKLKGLEDAIPITVVHHEMDGMGWRFVTRDDDAPPPPQTEPEPLYGLRRLRELYFKADPEYGGRFTVPVLWDTKTETIVNNESSELIVMLNCEFNACAKRPELDMYPEENRKTIDEVAQSFYNSFNNGVYRCGFATTQEAYELAFDELFETMDNLEERLSKSRYLCGDKLTLADIRLFPTAIRFDCCYVQHFKTNWRTLKEYPNFCAYTRELYQVPEIRATVNFEHIKKHYTKSHPTINPLRITPKGPDLSYLDEPHGRG